MDKYKTIILDSIDKETEKLLNQKEINSDRYYSKAEIQAIVIKAWKKMQAHYSTPQRMDNVFFNSLNKELE